MARVLLVEDEDLLRNGLERHMHLKFESFEVVSVSNGRQALALFDAGEHFDLVVSDKQMPELHGDALCRMLRDRGHQVPFILLSGSFEAQKIGDACGATVCLAKPMNMRELDMLIETLVTLPQPTVPTAP